MLAEAGVKKAGPELLAVVALACITAGLVLGIMSDLRTALGSGISGVVAAVSLLLLKAKMDSDVARRTEGALQLDYAPAFWLLLLVLLGAAGLNIYFYSEWKKESRIEGAGADSS